LYLLLHLEAGTLIFLNLYRTFIGPFSIIIEQLLNIYCTIIGLLSNVSNYFQPLSNHYRNTSNTSNISIELLSNIY